MVACMKVFKKVARYLSQERPEVHFANFSNVIGGMFLKVDVGGRRPEGKDVIYLDPRGEVLAAYLHEALHAVYPYGGENLIELVGRRLGEWMREPEWYLILELLYFNLQPE